MDGPWDPDGGHRFDPTKVLLDPYARVIGGRDVWGVQPDWNDPYQHRARLASTTSTGRATARCETPIEDLVIYEMHVRGFTAHPSSGVDAPGTFAGDAARRSRT